MRIHAPRVESGASGARLSARVDMGGEARELWIEVPEDVGADLTVERLDGFVVSLLVVAMRLGEPLVLEAPISARLHAALVHDIMPLLALQVRGARVIEVRAPALDDRRLGDPRHVGAGFSAGIDSFCTVFDHFAQETQPGWRITELVFANIGSHGAKVEAARELFHKRLAVLNPFAAEIGLRLVPIDSNGMTFYSAAFQETHVPRTLGAVMALQRRYARYFFSSSYPFAAFVVGQQPGDIGFVEALLVPMIASENLEMRLAGARYRRRDKLARLIGYEPSHRFLNVCSDPAGTGRNCSRCWKCVRVIMMLEMMGKIDLYRQVFDLEVFRRHRHDHLDRLFARNVYPGTQDVLDMAKETGYRLRPPPLQDAWWRVRHAAKRARRAVGRIAGRGAR